MSPSPHITVSVDLDRIRASAEAIGRATGTAVLAVVKADAYGLGAAEVSHALRDRVAGWCVFRLDEAIEAGLGETGLPTLALGPPEPQRLAEYLQHRVRPAVSSVEAARALRAAGPVLCVDTGMQRFACPPERVDEVIAAGEIREAFTHAVTLQQVEQFVDIAGGRGLTLHAAATALLHEPRARLDAVRPGLALYDQAVRISAPLVEVNESRGPVGYTGFTAGRIGVILGGYSNGLRPGRCVVNGQPARIVEVGMQSAYIDLTGLGARVGDEVVLLGPGAQANDLASDWGTSPHAVLVSLACAGRRVYG